VQYPQILVYETDGVLAATLREKAKAQRWALREPRKSTSCLRLLRGLSPSVLILKMGISSGSLDSQDSWELLANVHERFPDAKTVVVGDTEDIALTNLAWDLGASYVLPPAQCRTLLPDIVVSLMQEVFDKCKTRTAD
jgi:hypothetical protein